MAPPKSGMLPESGSIPRKSTKYLPSTRLQGGGGEEEAEEEEYPAVALGELDSLSRSAPPLLIKKKKNQEEEWVQGSGVKSRGIKKKKKKKSTLRLPSASETQPWSSHSSSQSPCVQISGST